MRRFALVIFLSATGCGLQGLTAVSSINSGVSCTPMTTATTTAGTNNVIPIAIGCGYLNQPCVTVTICEPNTNNCEVIPNILLDTGSYGLRVFSCAAGALNLTTQTKTVGLESHEVGECVTYLDGSAEWGPVKIADVILGTERAEDVPIHIVDAYYKTVPNSCGTPEHDPSLVGFNGILGVGLQTYDCGTACTVATFGQYFTCDDDGTCTDATLPLAKQVRNPVTLMTTNSNNNGVIITLPAVPSGGTSGVTGTMTMGIDTAAGNNSSAGETVYPADANANFDTIYPVGGSTFTAFIDSGSNLLSFPNTITNVGLNLPMAVCGNGTLAWGLYCPTTSPNALTAQQVGATGAPTSATINFDILHANNALASGTKDAFDDLGAPLSGYFDWGLPFFLGRTVIVQFEGTTSGLGATTNGFWAW